MLEGAVQRATGKGLRDLNLDLAGKTGTTNKNTDTWFIGYTSKLIIGVFVGFDNPKSLGKKETGERTAMPIFKEFITEVDIFSAKLIRGGGVGYVYLELESIKLLS